MLNIFRKKKGRLFPSGYIDIHNHILPGIDDGSPDVETSIYLLEELRELGIRKLVFTPHVMEGVWENSTTDIAATLGILEAEWDTRNRDGFSLHAAAEYMMDEGFLARLERRDLLPISGNILLVEMSFVSPPMHLYKTIADIQVAGYRPLLAHPERYFFLHQDWEEYKKLRSAGCLFQLNMLSMSHYYGKEVRNTALQLLKKGDYHYIGSDLHHERHLHQIQKLAERKEFWRKVEPLMENNSQLVR